MNILLTCDQAMLRDGLRQSLLNRGNGSFEVTAADSWTDALAIVREDGSLSVVVVDLDMAGFRFDQAIGALRACGSSVPIVAISACIDLQRITDVLHGGAAGYVPKSESFPVLIGAIGLALAGGVYVPRHVLRRPEPVALVPGHEAPRIDAYAGFAASALTSRQSDVLRLLAQGKPNKVISRELGIASGTVKAHVTALLRALRVNNRTEAASAILKRGDPASGLGQRALSRLN